MATKKSTPKKSNTDKLPIQKKKGAAIKKAGQKTKMSKEIC